MRPVPQIAVDFVKQHEGCRLTGYADVAGLATVGYGHCGPEVRAGQTITQDLADTYLREDLAIAAKRLAARVDEGAILKLSDHQYAALLSFVFNVGCGDWVVWRWINSGLLDGVPSQLERFVYAGGKIIPGLVNRRAAEIALWNTPDGLKPAPPPPVSSAVTRDAVAPTPKPGFFARLLHPFIGHEREISELS